MGAHREPTQPVLGRRAAAITGIAVVGLLSGAGAAFAGDAPTSTSADDGHGGQDHGQRHHDCDCDHGRWRDDDGDDDGWRGHHDCDDHGDDHDGHWGHRDDHDDDLVDDTTTPMLAGVL